VVDIVYSMGRLSQKEKVAFLGENRFLGIFLSQNEYK
jgi:hypothetical protein